VTQPALALNLQTEMKNIPDMKPIERKENGNGFGGRPRLDRDKVWELLHQKRCWYCDTPVAMDAEKCGRCGKGRFEAWTPTEIARYLKMGRASVYRIIEEMPKDYKPEILDYTLPTDLENCESIQNWRSMIKASGHLSTLTRVPPIIKICKGEIAKGFKCHPDRFDLEKAKQFVSIYLEEHKDKKKLSHQLRLGIRSFFASKNIAIPRGFGQQLGLGGEKESFGKYGHIKLSDDQIDQIRDFLSDDPETLLFFDAGIEWCTRAETIARTEISKIERVDGLVQIRVYESKTDKTWMKYLLTTKYPHAKETADELEAYMKEHSDRKPYLFLDREEDSDKFQARMCQKLREAYEAIGLNDPYFYKRPIHSLRHIGAHLWLRRTNWDYVLVAKIGGWDDVQTLIDCYGEMTADVVLQKIMELEKA